MSCLFYLQTSHFSLKLDGPPAFDGQQPGRLRFVSRDPSLAFLPGTWRGCVPHEVAGDVNLVYGPGLEEDRSYALYARSKTSDQIRVDPHDPVVERGLVSEDGGRITYGVLNYRRSVGIGVLSIFVGGKRVCDIEIEVFPTKVDYQTDYKQMLADVQDSMAALVLEYMRATHQFGSVELAPEPTRLEWILILRYLMDELERAVHQISRRPLRSLMRTEQTCPVEKVRRVDGGVRSSIRRRGIGGPCVLLSGGVWTRRYVRACERSLTLDTPEHRWIAAQLNSIQRILAQILRTQNVQDESRRQALRTRELRSIERRVARLSALEPFKYVVGRPPAGFTSIALMNAPGYREAYRNCLLLRMGLRVHEGPMALSVRELDVLYEQWCYITLLRLIADATGDDRPLQSLATITSEGVSVNLAKGKESQVTFRLAGGSTVAVLYNPEYGGKHGLLVPQRPDIVLVVRHPGWPEMRLVLDAKYRIQDDQRYVEQFGTAGPPEDALNSVHRYRDAIVQVDDVAGDLPRRRHCVVHAAVVFPWRDTVVSRFRDNRAWRMLGELGVGAIPALPGSIEYLREWLTALLEGGGWSLADRALSHIALESAWMRSRAASQTVLVASLRAQGPAQELLWVERSRQYYMPYFANQERQFDASAVAFYSPASLRHPPAVTHIAAVKWVEVKERGSISTPWQPSRPSDELQVLYHLGDLEPIANPIVTRSSTGPMGQTIRSHRWTSSLAIERAESLEQLMLETEQEWRLFEGLCSRGAQFQVRAQDLRPVFGPVARPHAWFCLPDGTKVRYAESAGFEIRKPRMPRRFVPNIPRVLSEIA